MRIQPETRPAVRRFDDPRIIEFRPRPYSGRKRPPPVIDPIRSFERDEYRRRMQQNFVAIALLAVLTLAGLWLYHELRRTSNLLACIEADLPRCTGAPSTGN